ncbi:ion channel [Secundilactobacillus kimchicus]|uniref:ion channel n=1 Tax=Secundilactobacillus kimchicus TaxID=528209 RepID=UPI0024A87617|nr:ion channel [Secundilactobacillus kimchicus]
MKANQRWQTLYELLIVFLALFSIGLVIFDFIGAIDIDRGLWMAVDDLILVVFTIDYFARLFIAKDKWGFFKTHLFDLLAILPFNAVFNFFRIGRVAQLARLARLLRLIGFTGKTQLGLKRLLRTNGLIYLVWITFALLLISATIYSYSEGISWPNSMWWAITTASTVGYGDISPHTLLGRIAAAALMLVGVAFIGMLTSSLTAYFAKDDTQAMRQELLMTLRHVERRLNEVETPQLIREYKALLDDGLITAEEFKAKREELLRLPVAEVRQDKPGPIAKS